MKKLLVFGIVALMWASCSKSKLSNEDKPETVDTTRVTGGVVIGGNTYPTITIGNQEWITQNYMDSTGIANPGGVVFGNLYTKSEAKSIELPEGWRIPKPADFVKLIQREQPGYKRGDRIDSVTIIRYLSRNGSVWGGLGNNASGFNALPAGFYARKTGGASASTLLTEAVILLDDSAEADYERAITIKLIDPKTLYMADIISRNIYKDGEVYNLANRFSLRFVRDRVVIAK